MPLIAVLLFGALVTGKAQAMVYCDSEFCNRLDCLPISSCPEGQRILKGGSVCGCCDTCITVLGEGETCRDPPMPGLNLVTKECASDFYCHDDSSVCVRKTCTMKYQEVQDRVDAANGMLLGYTFPNCREDGSFGPVQCSGAVCFCTNREGEQLYMDDNRAYQFRRGYASRNANCQCALDEHEAQQSQTQRTFRCAANGNYQARPY